jgi:hypothetical protein
LITQQWNSRRYGKGSFEGSNGVNEWSGVKGKALHGVCGELLVVSSI